MLTIMGLKFFDESSMKFLRGEKTGIFFEWKIEQALPPYE